jgi:hypothetical protein
MVALTPGLRRRSFEFASVSGLAPSAAALGSSVSVCFVSVGVSTPDICCSIFRLLWIAPRGAAAIQAAFSFTPFEF